MRNTIMVFILLFGSFSVKAGLDVYTVDQVPKPRFSEGIYVIDANRLLKPETVQLLNEQLMGLEQITTDQVAVIILGSIGDYSTREFATRLFNRYRIGQKEKDNGLLILVVMDQKRVEFETGYGMEGILPDVICKRIQMQYMIPKFKEGNYDQGIVDGVHAIIELLASPGKSKLLLQNAPERIVPQDPLLIEKTIAWILFFPYLFFIVILYFIKRSKGTFTESYEKLSEAKRKLIPLTIPKGRWLLLYVFLPTIFFGTMIYGYQGPYYGLILFSGVYAMILLVLLEKRIRSAKAYASSYNEGDYYTQYQKFNFYFDNWGVAAVFFPIPFLLTDFQNNKKLKAIRQHERTCPHCETNMELLDEVTDDKYLEANQVLEESIKSVDYDVWLCPSCKTHYALSYIAKKSKYKVCPQCSTKAYYLESDMTITPATRSATGLGEKIHKCLYCKKVNKESYTIPKISSSSSSGSSGGSGSFRGSSGGGRSGGGGAGSRW